MAKVVPWKRSSAEAWSTNDPLAARAAELFNRLEQLDAQESDDAGWLDERWGQLQRKTQQQDRRPAFGDLAAFSAVVASAALLAFGLVRAHRSERARPGTIPLAQARPAEPARPAQIDRSQTRPEPVSAPSIPTEPWAAWPRVDSGSNGTLWVRPGATVRLPDSPTEPSSDPRVGYRVLLERGSLCAEVTARRLGSEGPFSVGTPHLEVTVIGTHFCVEATAEASSVSVQRGRVHVAWGAESSLILAAGESIRSDSGRLRVAGGSRPEPRLSRDRSAPESSTLPAAVDGLGRENGLYQSALDEVRQQHHARAAGLLADYLRGYPTGLFAPEVSSELATELALAGRYTESLDAARRKLRLFPDAAHDGELELLMAGLIRDQLARPADALPLYEGLVNQSANREWRAEGLFGRGACEERLGNFAAAKASWRQYLADYPADSRVAQVRRLLGE